MDSKITKNKKEFANLISKLDVEEFFGVCKIMNIPIINEDNTDIRSGADIIVDVLEKFPTYNRTQRRNLLRLVRAAVKANKYTAKEEKEDGTEN